MLQFRFVSCLFNSNTIETRKYQTQRILGMFQFGYCLLDFTKQLECCLQDGNYSIIQDNYFDVTLVY